MPRLVCAICEVKAPAVEIGSLRLLLIEGEELLGSALIHHLKPALAIKLLGGIKILPLVACKLCAGAIVLRKGVSKLREVGRFFRKRARFKIGFNIRDNSCGCNPSRIRYASVCVAFLCREIYGKLVILTHNLRNDATQRRNLLCIRHSCNINTVCLQADITHIHKDDHTVRISCVVG